MDIISTLKGENMRQNITHFRLIIGSDYGDDGCVCMCVHAHMHVFSFHVSLHLKSCLS